MRNPVFVLVFVTIISCAVAQNSFGNRPEQCESDPNFCMNFCLSTNKDTVYAQCGKDKASCICTDQFRRSVKVRLIEERSPVPPTTPPPPRPTQYVNSEPVNPHNGGQQMPELLHCDASEHATHMCNQFCITDIGAFRGLCNVTDFTCLCQGVSPMIVQNVPISAIFNGPLLPPPTTPPPPSPKNTWTPITPSHPNYNPNSISNGYYHSQPPPMPQGQPPQQYFQQQYSPYRPPEPHYVPNPYGQPFHGQTSPQHIQHQFPQEQVVGQEISMTQSVSEHVEDELNSTPEANTEAQVPKESVPEVSETHRKRRSAEPKSSYPSVLSFGLGQSQKKRRSCSIYSCEDACTRSEYNMPKCLPKCVNDECLCMCKPSFYDDMIDEIMQGGYESPPPQSTRPLTGGDLGSLKPILPPLDNFDMFKPPPALY